MSDKLTLEEQKKAVAESKVAGFRCRAKLSPAGGPGDKVFPPTYAGAVYASEKRRLPNHEEPVDCVLLDSVQSQANRMEEALQNAIDDGRLNLPVIEVDFTKYWDPESKNEKLTDDMRLLDPTPEAPLKPGPGHRDIPGGGCAYEEGQVADPSYQPVFIVGDERGAGPGHFVRPHREAAQSGLSSSLSFFEVEHGGPNS